MRRIILIGLALCLAAAPSMAQKDAVKKIIEMGRNENQVMEHLDVLCNRIGGRVIGSNAYDNAVQWVAAKFREWGLEVEVQEAGTLPVGFNRGPWFGRMLGEKNMQLHFATPAYTVGTKGVQRGHVLLEPMSQGEFNSMKSRLKGAWVLVNGTSNGFAIDRSPRGDSIRRATLMKNDSIRKLNQQITADNRKNNTNNPTIPLITDGPALFYKEMCEAGVLGFIQSAKVPLQAHFDRTVLTDPTFTFDNLPKACDIKLDEHQYAEIKQLVKERHTFFLEFEIRNPAGNNFVMITKDGETPLSARKEGDLTIVTAPSLAAYRSFLIVCR